MTFRCVRVGISLSDQLCLSVSSSDSGLCEGLPINREEPQAAVPRSATLHKPPGTFHSGGGEMSGLCPVSNAVGVGAVCFLSCETNRKTSVEAGRDGPKAAKFSPHSGGRL